MAVNFLISPLLSPINFQALDNPESNRYHTKWPGEDFFSLSIPAWMQQRASNGTRIEYAQKWQRTDRLTPQIAVPLGRAIRVGLYNCAGVKVADIANYTTASYAGDLFNGTPLQRHQFNFTLGQLDVVNARYFIVIEVSNEQFDNPDKTYKAYISDPLNFRDAWPYTALLEVSNQRSEYNIRFDMVRRFALRVECFTKPLPPIFQDTTLEDQQSNGRVLYSGVQYPYEFTFGARFNKQQALPALMVQKISEMMRCNRLLIDGRPWYRPSNAGLEISELGVAYPLFNASITLHAQDAQNNDVRGIKSVRLLLPNTYPFFTTGITINDGGAPQTVVPIGVIENSTARAAIPGNANALGFDGTFSIEGDYLMYEYGGAEQGISLDGRFYTRSFSMQTTYNATTLPANTFSMELQGSSAVGISWGDGTAQERVLNPNVYTTTAKTYITTNNKLIRVFHRDDLTRIRITINNSRNQVTAVSGDLPAQLKRWQLSNQAVTTLSGAFFASIKVPMLELLIWSNNLTTSISTIDWDNNSVGVAYVQFSQNSLSSANVDALFNDLYNPGAYDYGGQFLIEGQTPAAPPTSASAGARQGLIDAGWTLTTD